MIKCTSQHRLCSDNKTIGTNIIMDLIPKSFEDHFEDIIDSDEKLRQNYISTRRPLSGHGIRINNLEEHYCNKIEQWSAVNNNWQPKQTDNKYSREIMEIIKDEAEFNLFDRILNIVGYITERNQTGNQLIQIQHILPEKRLIFLQAGIGSGKTTMLHHFSRITLPDLAVRQLLPINFISTIVDFNPIDESKDMEIIWEEIVRDIRIKIENTTDMRNPAGWKRIAQHEIFDENGHYLPEIELAANREEEISQIVIKAKDDKVFLNRISRYLLNTHPQGIIVIIFDNLDMHGNENQLGYIRKLMHFVAGVENVIGIITTRECTVGNLNHLQEFQTYMHLDRMFMTTPYIGEMLSRRFESCIGNINETASRNVMIDLDNRNTTISQVDIRNILKHIHTAIDIENHNNNSKPAAADLNESCTTLTQFLNQITNSNARNTLQLVTHALKSWALDLTPIVTEYLWQRDRKILPIKLPPFSIDEIIRLTAVGQREFYQQEGDDYIINIFSIGNTKSEPENGKFPVLYMYRIFQFFEIKGGKVIMTELINHFDIFGYTTSVLRQVLKFMLKTSFIESPQGNMLENIRVLYSTEKLTFYYGTFCKMLVYLENIRNDCIIDYDAPPHYVRDGLCHDLLEIYKFIWYIMEQEQKEFRYIKEHGNHSQDIYKSIVADQPVAWKLFKSVQLRCEELFNTQRHLFPLPERQKIFDNSKQLYLKIIELCKEGEIWPAIPPNDLRKITDFMKNFTMI